MPPKDAQKTDPDPDRVRTRAKNANTHPGMAAKEALRVRNPPRDPDTIQTEKDKKALKKVEKKKTAEDSKAKEQQAAQFVEEYRARKDSETMKENAAIPRQKPKASKNVPDTKEPDLKPVEETQERQGTKRKPSQLDNTGKQASMPLKKAKTTEEPPTGRSTSARVALHQNSASITRQKPASVTPRRKPAEPTQNPVAAPSYNNKNSKKRNNLTDDAFPEDPKTPAPPLKKPRVNRNALEENSKKPQARAKPLRRSETLIYEDGSGVKTTRPNKDVDKVEHEGGFQNAVIELSDGDQLEESYVTPFLLQKKKRKIAPPPEETELEHSEVEQQLRGKASKKAGPVKSSTDKIQSAAAAGVRAHSSESQKNKKAVTVPITNSSTTIKRTTANSNNVIVTHTSAAPGPKAKKSKQVKPRVKMHDSDEDDSHEEKAALASPLKGSESRKLTKMKVKVERNNILKAPDPLSVGTVKIFNNDVLPTWIAQVFASNDSWPNIDDHLNKLQIIWDEYLGEKYPHRIDNNTDIYHKAKARLCDLRNRMKNKSDQVVLDEFRKWVGDNEEAMKDQEKRIAFGKEYCNSKEWKFIWKVFNEERGIRGEKYKNKMILETFAIYFTFATPANPLPDEIGHPQGALALATAAVERSLSLYRDDHLEWNKGALSLKAENAQQKTEKTRTDSAKLKKSLKYDFSYTNWGETTGRWLKGIKKRYPDLFPDISKQARVLAGIKCKPTNADTESSSESESGSDSGRDLDSNHEGFGNAGSNDDHQSDNEADNEGDDGHGHGGDGGIEGSDGEGLRVEGEGDEFQVAASGDDVDGPDGDEFAASGDDINGPGGVESTGDSADEDYEMLEIREEPGFEPSVSDLSDITTSD